MPVKCPIAAVYCDGTTCTYEVGNVGAANPCNVVDYMDGPEGLTVGCEIIDGVTTCKAPYNFSTNSSGELFFEGQIQKSFLSPKPLGILKDAASNVSRENLEIVEVAFKDGTQKFFQLYEITLPNGKSIRRRGQEVEPNDEQIPQNTRQASLVSANNYFHEVTYGETNFTVFTIDAVQSQ